MAKVKRKQGVPIIKRKRLLQSYDKRFRKNRSRREEMTKAKR